jgi:homoserine dehydrogenase
VVFKVGLLGLGTVGAGTVQILQTPADRHPLLSALEIAQVGVRDLTKPRPVELPAASLTTDLESIVTDPDIDIIVEVMGGLEPARTLLLKAIHHGKHVVTANKALISRHGEELYAAAAQTGVYVLIEAAVGGGIPVIEPIKQSLCANRIQRITGIINGTTNYILTRMAQEGAEFETVLADAQRLGYAEADPSADVDGGDAADKLAILASLAFGGRIDRAAVPCEGIRSVGATEIAYAAKLGFVIKLLGIAERSGTALSIRVHPTLVPLAHPLANVNDVYNAIVVEGDPVGQVMFYGRGAGAGPTASAVVADLLNIAAWLTVGRTAQQADGRPQLDPLLATGAQAGDCPIGPLESLVTRFYVRFLTQDYAGVIGRIGTSFGNHRVSLESVVQAGMRDGLAEIVVVTHDVREGDFRLALAEIEALPEISQVASLLRVL